MSKLFISPLAIPGVALVNVKKFSDARGWLMESYARSHYAAIGIDCEFVQDNQSMSIHRGTVRGLHLQNPPEPQAKLVRVLKGAIFDVAVDIRKGSPTYGRWCGATLTADLGEQLFIPHGFAHAFCTLEPYTEVAYKADGYYAPACEAGIIWNDASIGIEWPIATKDAILSAKDARLPSLAEFDSPFRY